MKTPITAPVIAAGHPRVVKSSTPSIPAAWAARSHRRNSRRSESLSVPNAREAKVNSDRSDNFLTAPPQKNSPITLETQEPRQTLIAVKIM
jgi:hypothetical protein